ncbi:SecDF P1 head subdomain-containing protein [Sphingobacterium corticibacterium]|uniref:SecDF P1 head subdomain domain-containing protein n=1 Tax=Sphingobacterium corticibacterium TaxID=2484746 RepID=A0A4Q6XXK7_9SPHI|nr:hypothetical protein [Sphingobacterium corticibacterium]RZF62522.1 hypothetical protein EWE74_06895 [Sphingobacterium corticibacterium]
MKQIGLTLLCYLSVQLGILHGQTKEKHYIGRYGHNDGVCLFEDGQFLLYGYATAVFGRYQFQGNEMLFYPDKRDLFEVYGTQNPQIEGKQSRYQFMGFEEGETFAKFDQDSIYRVFNADANCFNYPYSTNRTQPVEHITLMSQPEDSAIFQTFHFANTAAHNDFVLVYNKVDRVHQDFVGRLEGNVLKLSNYGGEDGYKKKEEDTEWDEILQWKAQYEALIAYQEHSYTDEETQTEYHKLPLQKSNDQPSASSSVAKSPIFYTVCEGSLELWSPDAENIVNTEAPFPTDKPDGFYWVKEVDRDNYANTHLEDDAVLSLKDIEIAKHEFTPDGRPVVTVNLTAEGKEKLATFTGNHIGQHMAIVVNKTVLSIPRIQEEIPGGSLQISGNFTVEEVQNIATRLNNR